MSSNDPRLGTDRAAAPRSVGTGETDALACASAELDTRLDAVFARRTRPVAGTTGETVRTADAATLDDLDDLRNELRASLASRVAELTASGTGPTAAVVQAFDELGDVEEIIAEVTGVDSVACAQTDPSTDSALGVPQPHSGSLPESRSGGTPNSNRDQAAKSAPLSTAVRDHAELMRRHRVRPKPAFVVRTVVFALVAAVGLALVVLAAFGMLDVPIAASVTVATIVLAVPVGTLVGDGVRQETTMSFPVPGGRAASYGASAFLGTAALALGGLFVGCVVRGAAPVWMPVIAAILLVASIAWFGYLGATQTNRKKPWARRLVQSYQGTDRFSQDEAAAARFGIYTVVIFIAAIAVFLVLSFTIGFAWSWLALVAGILVFFLTLARMLFPNDRSK